MESIFEHVMVTVPQEELALTRFESTVPLQSGMVRGLQPKSMLVGILVNITVQGTLGVVGTSMMVNCSSGVAWISTTTASRSPHCICHAGPLACASSMIA